MLGLPQALDSVAVDDSGWKTVEKSLPNRKQKLSCTSISLHNAQSFRKSLAETQQEKCPLEMKT